MFSRSIFSAYPPKNPPPSISMEKFCSKGSSGAGGGLGCWASAMPPPRIMTDRRLSKCLAFIRFPPEEFALYTRAREAGSKKFLAFIREDPRPKIVALRLRRGRLIRSRSFPRCGPDRDVQLLQKPRESDE